MKIDYQLQAYWRDEDADGRPVKPIKHSLQIKTDDSGFVELCWSGMRFFIESDDLVRVTNGLKQ